MRPRKNPTTRPQSVRDVLTCGVEMSNDDLDGDDEQNVEETLLCAATSDDAEKEIRPRLRQFP